ncbi:unnamed protein product [Mytilus coruscus]|uniref:Uncharacterized protein n=1 Tax=Mytilus coruscus TaxID=42192 RepID=A0A6J8A782_MYTCO|nr:unnamed protein product [Mytilus coruscus]
MYRFKKVSITTLRDKTIQGAKEFLETGKMNAKNILFQVGSNDLEVIQPKNVVEEIEQLIIDTKKSLPKSQIIISQILPRFYRNQNLEQEYEVKKVECNQLLYELCKRYEAYYVQHENLTQVHFQDGIHLNKQRGIKLYVRNLKEIVNPLIGVKSDDQDSSRNHHVREKPDGASNFTRYRQPNKMYNNSLLKGCISMQNMNIDRKYSEIDMTFKWETISKEKLYTVLEESSTRDEILGYENTPFEINCSGVERAEQQLNNIFKTLTMRSCKIIKSFRKKKLKKKKPWEDRELADVKKTVSNLAKLLRINPYNLNLRNNFLGHCKLCKKLIKRKKINLKRKYLVSFQPLEIQILNNIGNY